MEGTNKTVRYLGKLSDDRRMVDFGTPEDGYCSDLTRTFVVGKVSGEYREAYKTIPQAQMIVASSSCWYEKL